MMNRDLELEGINGTIKIDEYNEMNGYSVAESTAEYLAQWAKDNAQDQAVLAGEPLACEFFKAGYTKNNKLWLCFKTPANKLGVLSISPALAHDIAPDLLPTEATYKVSPRGLKLYAGEQWTLTEKEINARLQGYTIAVQFEESIIKGKDGKPDEKRTVPRLLDIF